MVGRDFFTLDGVNDEPDGEVLASFLKQFYESAVYIPKHVVVPFAVPESSLIAEWLTEKRGTKVDVAVAQRGVRRRMTGLAAENARESLDMLRVRWLADSDKRDQALTELQEELDLPTYPRRIECYDNSNIQGSSPVASMVVFIDGQPRPQEYRRFRIKTVVGANDFASMAEILGRRFKRWENGAQSGNQAIGQDEALSDLGRSTPHPNPLPSRGEGTIGLLPDVAQALTSNIALMENEQEFPLSSQGEGAGGEVDDALLGWGALPDLVIVDGGKGQLSAALDVMRNLGLKDVPVAGLAKQNEELFVQDLAEPIILSRTSQALYLVQRLRDEAHRFAITYHRKVRARSGMESALDSVPGVGPKRKRALLRKFGSLRGVREASVEDIASTIGFTRSLAEKVKQYL
jgi:excinuclease ABC subunit C